MTATVNLDIKRGVLCEDAQIFPTRKGRPKLTFRLQVPRSRSLPRKVPVSADFFSVVTFKEEYVDLAPLLTAGTEVLVIGFTQSRDAAGGVVTEILAQHITILPKMPDLSKLLGGGEDGDGEEALAGLAWYLASELDIARQQGQGDLGQWPVEEMSVWFAEKLRAQIRSGPAGGDEDGD